MLVAMRQRLKLFWPTFDCWYLLVLATVVALYLALETGQSAIAGRTPRALEVAEAAFISLGAPAALCLGYASLLPASDQNRRSFLTAGAHLFRAVTFVTLAAAFELLLRLYTQPPYSQWLALYAVVLALLIVGSTYFFARALISAWRGVTTILAALKLLEKSD